MNPQPYIRLEKKNSPNPALFWKFGILQFLIWKYSKGKVFLLVICENIQPQPPPQLCKKLIFPLKMSYSNTRIYGQYWFGDFTISHLEIYTYRGKVEERYIYTNMYEKQNALMTRQFTIWVLVFMNDFSVGYIPS